MIDASLNTFFVGIGGLPFLGLLFGGLIIIAILISLIRPIDN
jgi:hypothetical protein